MFGDDRLPERFWAKVSVSESGCWNWSPISRADGYGAYYTGNRRMSLAHRVAYAAIRGEIPAGLQIDHLCRNRSCVNPDHLEPVSHRENIIRGVSPSAVNGSKDHCKRGHALTPENVHEYHRRGGVTRVCRACMRINSAIARKKRPEYHLEYGRRYRREHREELNAKQRAYVARKKEQANG